MSDVTLILQQIETGDPSAADKLLPLVYDELRKLAAARMAQERPDHTLQATALVHEAYVRLVGEDQIQGWDSRGHFFGAAAEAMRRILVESGRRKQSIRHGGEHRRVEIDELVSGSSFDLDLLIDLDAALSRLASTEPQTSELVRLRLFAGLSLTEAGKCLGLARRTAYEHWDFARSWLGVHLGEADA